MEFLILLGLILLNGVLAMSELAIVSVNTARLEQDSDDGDENATTAISLAEDSNRFLSTVQIGITLVGIFAGAFGGTAISGDIAEFLTTNFSIAPDLANQVSLATIVLLTTYLSLVIGELVPKRIALSNPERIALLVARPMNLLSRISAPLVWFLSKSTEIVARLIGIKDDNNRFITDFEVIAIMREGIVSGEFDAHEHEMVKGALQLDDIQVREIATPRVNIEWLDIRASEEVIRQKLSKMTFSVYPVCEDDIDNIVGVVRAKDLLTHLALSKNINLKYLIKEPFYVPQTAIAADVLQKFKTSTVNTALILDEFGGIDGIITMSDIIEEVLGDLNMTTADPVQRADGSWLIDGQHPIIELPELLTGFDLPEDERSDYHTIAGFVLKRVGRIPVAADNFEWNGYKIEVVDMDGKRVDKVLISNQSDI